MRSTITLLILSFLPLSFSFGQECIEILNQAQTAYDEGRIHELVDNNQALWGNCLNGDNLSTEEKVQAYRLLTLVYLQLDEPSKADENMLNLLAADPEYIINEAVDPTEFINLYNTFRTDAIFRIGVRGGGNFNYSNMLTRENIISNPESPATNPAFTFGWQAGLSMEFDLFKGKKTLQDLIINPEVFYASKKVIDTYEEDWRAGTYTGIFNSLQVNGIVHYEFQMGRDVMRKLRFLASTGPSFEYRLSVVNQANGSVAFGEEIVESPNIDATDAYKAYDFGWVLGGGIRLKAGRPWATLDIRYTYYFVQVVENKNANISSAITYGGFIRNEQRFQGITGNVGIHFPIFKHEKLID